MVGSMQHPSPFPIPRGLEITIHPVSVSTMTDEATHTAADDDHLFEVIDELFRTQINPAVAQHGGRIDLIDVEDGYVILRMMGGCQGCGMANVTLRQGIDASLKRTVPGYRGLRDITDHASGTNPYYAASSK